MVCTLWWYLQGKVWVTIFNVYLCVRGLSLFFTVFRLTNKLDIYYEQLVLVMTPCCQLSSVTSGNTLLWLIKNDEQSWTKKLNKSQLVSQYCSRIGTWCCCRIPGTSASVPLSSIQSSSTSVGGQTAAAAEEEEEEEEEGGPGLSTHFLSLSSCHSSVLGNKNTTTLVAVYLTTDKPWQETGTRCCCLNVQHVELFWIQQGDDRS